METGKHAGEQAQRYEKGVPCPEMSSPSSLCLGMSGRDIYQCSVVKSPREMKTRKHLLSLRAAGNKGVQSKIQENTMVLRI